MIIKGKKHTVEAEKDKKSGAEVINPYNSKVSKGKQVEKMFDSIAPSYDFMNTAMTFGLHRRWRDRALNAALERIPEPLKVLDIATGTGDVAFRLASLCEKSRITGIDLSRGMLKIAKKRLFELPYSIAGRIAFEVGDSMTMTYGNGHFDLVTVAYGVRNFENLRRGIAEIYRVMSEGATLCIIELSVPTNPVMKWGYNLYSRHIIPGIGRLISGDSRAYSYLPESIAAAPQRDEMSAVLRECGFRDIKWQSLTFGAVTYYLATKL